MNKESAFYKNIEKEKDLKNIIDIMMLNIDNLFSNVSESLFNLSELHTRKIFIKNQEKIRNRIEEIMLSKIKDGDKKEKVLSIVSEKEVEVVICEKKAFSLLNAYEVKEEKKINIIMKRHFGSEIKSGFNYGEIVGLFLKSFISILDDLSKELIKEMGLVVAMSWHKNYLENIKKASNFLIKKGVSKEIAEDEINLKPMLKNKISEPIEKNNWSFEEKINKLYDNFRNQEIKYNDSGSYEIESKKETYEMLEEIFLTDIEYKGKKEVKPINFLKSVENIEKNENFTPVFELLKKDFVEKTLPVKNLSVLKMISDLFDNILKENSMLEESKVLIYKLQFPAIKTSLINPDFIVKDNSIVNKVLKSITNDLKYINDNKGLFYRDIKECVENFSRIDFENLSEEKVVLEWNGIQEKIRKNNKRIFLIEKRNKEKEIGEDNYKKSYFEVEKEINSILLDSEFVPFLAIDFIEKEIKTNMILAMLKDMKEGGKKYQSEKELLKLWFNSLFVDKIPEEANKNSQELYKKLVENNSIKESIYREKLKEIYYISFDKNNVIDEKEKSNFQRKRYHEYYFLYNKSQENKEKIKQEEDSKYIFFKKMNYGDWIEVFKGDNWIKCKLLLKLNNDTKFIFVDSNGFKNLTIEIKELHDLYINKNIKAIDNKNIIEKALEEVIKI